jgi:hypothetical protein
MKDYIAEQWQLLGNNKTSQQWVLYGTTSVVKVCSLLTLPPLLQATPTTPYS